MSTVIRCDKCKKLDADASMVATKGFPNGSPKWHDLCKDCALEIRCVLVNTDDFTATLDEIEALCDNVSLNADQVVAKILKAVLNAKERRRRG